MSGDEQHRKSVDWLTEAIFDNELDRIHLRILAKAADSDFALLASRQTLANELGVSEKAVSNAISELRREGYLQDSKQTAVPTIEAKQIDTSRPEQMLYALAGRLEETKNAIAGMLAEIVAEADSIVKESGTQEIVPTYMIENICIDIMRQISQVPKMVRAEAFECRKVCQEISDAMAHNANVHAETAKSLSRALEKRPATHKVYDPAVRFEVWKMTEGKCVYCDGDVSQADLQVDHFVPKSCDGPDHINNYVPSCPACNQAKKDKHPVQFIREKLGRNVIRFNPNIEAAE